MTVSKNILAIHGMTYTAEYRTWYAMRKRCSNINNTDYRHYGGRGISVCDRWSGSHSFPEFLEDMGTKPSAKHSIDRIDNDGDYTPCNCRWALQLEQVKNQRLRKDNKTGVAGIRRRANDWIAIINNNGERHYLGLFNDFFSACCARKSAENKYWSNYE